MSVLWDDRHRRFYFIPDLEGGLVLLPRPFFRVNQNKKVSFEQVNILEKRRGQVGIVSMGQFKILLMKMKWGVGLAEGLKNGWGVDYISCKIKFVGAT